MAKAQKCTGGCGKSQDVTVAQRGAAKGAFSFAPPWTCPECKAKAEKLRAEKTRQKDAAEVGPKPEPDRAFTLVPRQTPGKLAQPPAPASSEAASDVGDAEPDVEKSEDSGEALPPKSAEA